MTSKFKERRRPATSGALLMVVVLGGCADADVSRETARAPATSAPASADAGAASSDSARPCIPSAGALGLIYDPSADALWPSYINDHAFARGSDQQWHLFGITHAEPALNAKDEREFAHASSTQLSQATWTKLPNALSADASAGETVLWAPHVILQGDQYWMFYAGGGSEDASYQIRLATSPDLSTWTRRRDPLFVDGYEARDPFVLRLGTGWVMYYTATDDPNGGHHVVAYRTSEDLLNWSARAIAYADQATGTGGGPAESPFVAARAEGYYLFIGSSEDYLATRVFYSQDPLQFSAPAIAELDTHASELVSDLDGQEYISHAGWGQGGVHLAPLSWRCGG